ncbi:MAG TPA: hypothetical protein VGH14_20005 [Solirubrobacterales bacterium]
MRRFFKLGAGLGAAALLIAAVGAYARWTTNSTPGVYKITPYAICATVSGSG